MRRLAAMLCLLFFMLPHVSSASGLTVEELRSAWASMTCQEGGPLLREPDPEAGDPGELNATAEEAALDRLNFFRLLAGVPADVVLDPLCTLRAQCGACVLAANDELTHEPECPAGFPEELYRTGLEGARKSDIMILNWQSEDILSLCTEYFVRDDGPENLEEVGHRRWMLRPDLKETGFGFAVSETGNSYTAMYVAGEETGPGGCDTVLWPAEGYFPAELMGRELAWTVMLDPARWSADADGLLVGITCDGEAVPVNGVSLCSGQIGGMICIAFVPELREEQRTQNRVFDVRLEGVEGPDGPGLAWQTLLCSLYPVDPAAVGGLPAQARLRVGEELRLHAGVIPDWADDLSLIWLSSDPSVAEVGADGLVRALTPGSCEITAEAVNGRSAVCTVTVE